VAHGKTSLELGLRSQRVPPEGEVLFGFFMVCHYVGDRGQDNGQTAHRASAGTYRGLAPSLKAWPNLQSQVHEVGPCNVARRNIHRSRSLPDVMRALAVRPSAKRGIA
jgi:hypothetical protein